MLRIAVLNLQLAIRYGAGDDESAGFNSIRNDRVLGAAQRFHAFNLDRRRARAAHARAHFVKKFGEIPDLRLARTVVKRRSAARQSRGHHQVLSPGNGNLFEAHLGAKQAPAFRRAGDHVAGFQNDFRTKFFESGEMKINRPRTDCAAAGQRNFRFPEARQQRPERQHRRAHGLDQFVRRFQQFDVGGGNFVGA